MKDITNSTLNRLSALGIAYITFGVVVFHIIEKFGWIDSLYYVVVTLATVGYGDIAPKTQAGKLFAVFYIIFGIVIFIAFAKALVVRLGRHREARQKAKKKK